MAIAAEMAGLLYQHSHTLCTPRPLPNWAGKRRAALGILLPSCGCQEQMCHRGKYEIQICRSELVWGGSKPVRLSSRNIKELMARGGLDKLSYLPKTFRDAIHITEQLEIDYLWIDALCIQHDDDRDLAHQINGMDKIY